MFMQHALFPDEAPGLPEGFYYQPELISVEDERALIEEISRLPLQPFEFHGYLGHRKVKAFGYRYDYTRRRAEATTEIPEFLLPLRAKVARFAGRVPADFVQALATEYPIGAGIGWHKDKTQFEHVVGVSLGSEAMLRLRQKDGKGWRRASTMIAPRSAYRLSGSVRHEWEHSIPEQDSVRYSVTFRTLAESFARSEGK